MRVAAAPFLALASLFQLVVALEVTPGSTCAALCLDNPETDPKDPRSSTTAPDDIVCSDSDYNTSPQGIKFQNCLDCLQKSNATSETENDSSWFLYNVRYSLDVCLYSFPTASAISKGVSSPCDTRFACQPVRKALEAGITNSAGDPYEYCSADGGAFSTAAANACIQCLGLIATQKYLPNFITALKAGCEQKPAPGRLLGLSGSIFDSHSVNSTAPPPPQELDDNKGSSSAFTTGAIVGIAVGAALLLLGGSALFWIYHRKQKRLYKDNLIPKFEARSGADSVSPPPQGGYPSTGGMPVMTNYELRAQKTYGRNAEYYDELEKDMQLRQNYFGALNTNNPRLGVHAALPTHPAYDPRTHSRQSSYESDAELQPRPVKNNKPDSYAIQAYLNASEEANAINMPPPPPGPPPPAAIRGSSLHIRSSSLAHDTYNPPGSHSRDSSIGSRGPSPDRRPLLNQEYYQQTTHSFLPPPPPPPQGQHQQTQFSILPPPPPQASTVPALSMPSLPKLRVPKKYAPPVITVQDATPVEGSSSTTTNQGQGQGQGQGEVPFGADISDPLVQHPPRFERDGLDKRRKKEPPPPLTASRSSSAERRPQPQWVMHEVELKTSKSDVFG